MTGRYGLHPALTLVVAGAAFYVVGELPLIAPVEIALRWLVGLGTVLALSRRYQRMRGERETEAQGRA